MYVGSDAPTDENVKVWIDPTGTPSQPSAGVIKRYLFPSAAVETMRLEGTYTFSAEETAAFHRAYADRHNTIFMIELKGADATISGGICSIAEIYETGNKSYLIHFPVDSLFANIFNYEMTLENQDGLLVFYV